ncbi:MAG: peptide-methionine (S)-S-oxide reductase [Pseudohongiellaceae bacterium]
MDNPTDNNTEAALATLGAGCYWCVEAVLQQVDGILGVSSGFMGGPAASPTYEEVCSGSSGHAEVVQVRFNPKVLSYEALLAWFWQLHDPTTLNRQGNDVGSQYRSVIFYHDEAQKEAALASKAAANGSGTFPGPVVTEVSPATAYFPANASHQDYYQRNRATGYCQLVIAPKLNKLGLQS